jgi:hypothetical protein
VIEAIALTELGVVLVVGRRLTRLLRPQRERAIVEAAAAQVRLSPHSAYDAGAAIRLLRREHAAVLGQGLIALVAVPFLFLGAGSSRSVPSGFPPALFVPLMLGILSRPLTLTLLIGWETVQRHKLAGPRIARLSAPAVGDYVRPITVWSARILAGVVVPATAIVTWASQSQGENKQSLGRGALVALVAFGLVTATALELASRYVVALPQPAAAPLELRWDDAIRSLQLNDLYTVASLLSIVAMTLTLTVLYGGGVARYTVVLGLLLFTVTGDYQARYRQRLWPSPHDPATA